jgi:hypothetical protein
VNSLICKLISNFKLKLKNSISKYQNEMLFQNAFQNLPFVRVAFMHAPFSPLSSYILYPTRIALSIHYITLQIQNTIPLLHHVHVHIQSHHIRRIVTHCKTNLRTMPQTPQKMHCTRRSQKPFNCSSRLRH